MIASMPAVNVSKESPRATLYRLIGSIVPDRVGMLLAISSAILLVIAFPDFNWWPLAWIGLVPLLVGITYRRQGTLASFVLGLVTGSLFFFGTCHWLTYAMIRYGHISPVLAYLMVFCAAPFVGLFHGLFAAALSQSIKMCGLFGLILAAPIWVCTEWLRFAVTGQLWNALGYSQAFIPSLIQTARWGGVYGVGLLIVGQNAAFAYAIVRRSRWAALVPIISLLALMAVVGLSRQSTDNFSSKANGLSVIAVQPNVPMEPIQSEVEMRSLLFRHINLSEEGLEAVPNGDEKIFVWPESPMVLTYSDDAQLRDFLASIAISHNASLLFNGLEPVAAEDGVSDGVQNSALLLDGSGHLAGRYDKIHLLAFGEYVPLPKWIPGVSLLPAMVGDFTPGSKYTVLPVGKLNAGVLICFESTIPGASRNFATGGADFLIEITNDGYLGPTAVLRQHLANGIFRAVETGRPLIRVTNTGITARIGPDGMVSDATQPYESAVRVWRVESTPRDSQTFYVKHGDVIVQLSALCVVLLLAVHWPRYRRARVLVS